MDVKEFLERARAENCPLATLAILFNLLELLDHYEGERCSVLAGKLRAALNEPLTKQ